MKIDEKRKIRYEAKLSFIMKRIEDLPPIADETMSQYRPYFVDALYYRIQTAIEAIMDIIAMLCKDNNIKVEDDYSNIENLISSNLLPPKLAEGLRKLNGLRNIIVHKYNHVDEKIVIESIDEIVEVITEFVEFTEQIIE